jgi:membrane fusion protein (multidrug efflux system)
VLLTLVAAAVLWIGQWFYHQHTHVSSNDARVVGSEVTVSSRLGGRISEFSLSLGDSLAEEDVVARLHAHPERMRVQALEAEVAAREARVDHQRQRIELSSAQHDGAVAEARERLRSAQTARDSARALMEVAEKAYQRSRELVDTGGVSVQQRDEDYYDFLSARAALERARHRVELERAALANARRGLMATPRMPLPEPGLLRSELEVMELELEQARADLREQRAHLDDMTVRSPIAGVVDKTFVEPGEYVAAGQPILMMHAPEDVWIEANIKETDVRELAKGQPVDIHVAAYPDAAYRGRLAVIGGAATSEFALLPAPNPSGNFTKITQRIPVKILIEEGPKAALKPGMMVVVDIDVRHHAD